MFCLKLSRILSLFITFVLSGKLRPGGYWDYFLMARLKPGLKPLPISKDFSPSKMTDFMFFQNFRKSGPISKG